MTMYLTKQSTLQLQRFQALSKSRSKKARQALIDFASVAHLHPDNFIALRWVERVAPVMLAVGLAVSGGYALIGLVVQAVSALGLSAGLSAGTVLVASLLVAVGCAAHVRRKVTQEQKRLRSVPVAPVGCDAEVGHIYANIARAASQARVLYPAINVLAAYALLVWSVRTGLALVPSFVMLGMSQTLALFLASSVLVLSNVVLRVVVTMAVRTQRQAYRQCHRGLTEALQCFNEAYASLHNVVPLSKKGESLPNDGLAVAEVPVATVEKAKTVSGSGTPTTPQQPGTSSAVSPLPGVNHDDKGEPQNGGSPDAARAELSSSISPSINAIPQPVSTPDAQLGDQNNRIMLSGDATVTQQDDKKGIATEDEKAAGDSDLGLGPQITNQQPVLPDSIMTSDGTEEKAVDGTEENVADESERALHTGTVGNSVPLLNQPEQGLLPTGQNGVQGDGDEAIISSQRNTGESDLAEQAHLSEQKLVWKEVPETSAESRVGDHGIFSSPGQNSQKEEHRDKASTTNTPSFLRDVNTAAKGGGHSSLVSPSDDAERLQGDPQTPVVRGIMSLRTDLQGENEKKRENEQAGNKVKPNRKKGGSETATPGLPGGGGTDKKKSSGQSMWGNFRIGGSKKNNRRR
jgi:membrane protein implicated in regulation of membrane protease activity